ncbi:WD40 repeat-like protein [Trametopsis cervina]|nr:WD40 repeat-like protein [Trametopsis cervina]
MDAGRGTQPWYKRRDVADAQPFVLRKFLSSKSPDAEPFYSVAAFPWHLDSLSSDGLYDMTPQKIEELAGKWVTSVKPWIDSVLVGSTGRAWIFRTGRPPLCIQLPRSSDVQVDTATSWHVKCVAWALDPRTWTSPLVILAAHNMVFVYDPTAQQMISSLTGHGGDITAIAVHLIHPYRFLTSSHDQTTRLYDLRYKPRRRANNPRWPPSKGPSKAGPAFGLHISGSEGSGFGRCIAVLAGGRAGGHQAAVLHAAWHPTADLIATCGTDRTVKIWRTPYVNYKKVNEDKEHLAREDVPLFSTDLIHKSRVLSVWWLSHDILLSHSAPALVRGKSLQDMNEEPGTIAVWRWLSYKRFLSEGGLRPVMRGSTDDWHNSESFKLLSVYSVPMATPSIHVPPSSFQSYDPLLFVPDGTAIRIFNVARFKPRNKPPFPLDPRDDDDDPNALENLTGAMRLSDGIDDNDYDYDDDDGPRPNPEVYRREIPEQRLFQDVEGWIVDSKRTDTLRQQAERVYIDKCEVTSGGRAIVGVGSRGTLYRWQLATEQV